MKSRALWRGGFGFGEIMALLLVVLPAMAFIVTFLIDYWAVMRIDNNLKLMTSIVSSKLNSMSSLSKDPQDGALEALLSKYCPKNQHVSFAGSRIGDGPLEHSIRVQVSASYDGVYLKNKTLTSAMDSYSYYDQSATIHLVCKGGE